MEQSSSNQRAWVVSGRCEPSVTAKRQRQVNYMDLHVVLKLEQIRRCAAIRVTVLFWFTVSWETQQLSNICLYHDLLHLCARNMEGRGGFVPPLPLMQRINGSSFEQYFHCCVKRASSKLGHVLLRTSSLRPSHGHILPRKSSVLTWSSPAEKCKKVLRPT